MGLVVTPLGVLLNDEGGDVGENPPPKSDILGLILPVDDDASLLRKRPDPVTVVIEVDDELEEEGSLETVAVELDADINGDFI